MRNYISMLAEMGTTIIMAFATALFSISTVAATVYFILWLCGKCC